MTTEIQATASSQYVLTRSNLACGGVFIILQRRVSSIMTALSTVTSIYKKPGRSAIALLRLWKIPRKPISLYSKNGERPNGGGIGKSNKGWVVGKPGPQTGNGITTFGREATGSESSTLARKIFWEGAAMSEEKNVFIRWGGSMMEGLELLGMLAVIIGVIGIIVLLKGRKKS